MDQDEISFKVLYMRSEAGFQMNTSCLRQLACLILAAALADLFSKIAAGDCLQTALSFLLPPRDRIDYCWP